MSLSAAMQEYLAEAYRLVYYQADVDGVVSTSALAQVMGVTDAATSKMIKRLAEEGYVERQPYQGIRLTPQGEYEALMNIRRHRLVERFLVDVMQFGWHEVHDDADELGAVVSDWVVDRMEQLAGYPRRCPHGEPIPSAEGKMPRVVDYPLNEIDIERTVVISRVNTHVAEKLAYIGSLGLLPGTRLTLLERAPFHGPLQLDVNGERCVMGYELAGVLRVCSEDEFALTV